MLQGFFGEGLHVGFAVDYAGFEGLGGFLGFGRNCDDGVPCVVFVTVAGGSGGSGFG